MVLCAAFLTGKRWANVVMNYVTSAQVVFFQILFGKGKEQELLVLDYFIDHLCSVRPKNHLNPRVHRSSGKLGEASFTTGTVDPPVGISLPHTGQQCWFLYIFIYMLLCIL